MPTGSTPTPSAAADGALTVRSGTAADVSEVLALWTAAGAHRTSTDDVPALSTLVARDPQALVVAEMGGRLVGTLIAAWDGWRGNMYRLAVLPAVRRRGVAVALVTEGERRLRARGCRRVSALVVTTDDHAVDFWTHVDYVPHPMERYVHTLPGAPGAAPELG